MCNYMAPCQNWIIITQYDSFPLTSALISEKKQQDGKL